MPIDGECYYISFYSKSVYGDFSNLWWNTLTSSKYCSCTFPSPRPLDSGYQWVPGLAKGITDGGGRSTINQEYSTNKLTAHVYSEWSPFVFNGLYSLILDCSLKNLFNNIQNLFNKGHNTSPQFANIFSQLICMSTYFKLGECQLFCECPKREIHYLQSTSAKGEIYTHFHYGDHNMILSTDTRDYSSC